MGVNPHRLDGRSVADMEKAVERRGDIAGFKIYAGYYHEHVYGKVYEPVYKLASEHGLAVAIHGGDTYFKGGLIEYSRPLHVDRLAHSFPDMKIVICHMGYPWVMEACEMAYKHNNVYIDLSGLAVGGAAECERMAGEPLIRDFFRQGLLFLNNYKKVIFGTDWPLAPIGPYVEMCRAIIPEYAREDVFYRNAAGVYGLG
jgi:predicted TIM-barrel fold metal-dependent hydrolase